MRANSPSALGVTFFQLVPPFRVTCTYPSSEPAQMTVASRAEGAMVNTGVETFATIFSIAPSPKDANVIWTGSDDGFVQVTRDGGTTWKNVTPKELGESARISLIEASPFRAGTAYVAANRYQLDDFKPYVFRTDDYGETWTTIVNGVEPNDFARAIREDIKLAKLLYLGHRARRLHFLRRRRELAVAAAEPAGHTGARHRGGAARPRHRDARPRVLRHGQHRAVAAGRSPDHDHLPSLQAGGRAARSRSFMAIDYYLKQPAQKVTMEFLDAQGKVIRTFTGTPADAERKPPAPGDDDGFRRRRNRIRRSRAGLQRLTWDMRYPGATDFPG